MAIFYAGYGGYTHVANVTSIVEAAVALNPTVYANNEYMQGDPLPGTTKGFFVVWQDNNGIYRSACCQEDDKVLLEAFRRV